MKWFACERQNGHPLLPLLIPKMIQTSNRLLNGPLVIESHCCEVFQVLEHQARVHHGWSLFLNWEIGVRRKRERKRGKEKARERGKGCRCVEVCKIIDEKRGNTENKTHRRKKIYRHRFFVSSVALRLNHQQVTGAFLFRFHFSFHFAQQVFAKWIFQFFPKMARTVMDHIIICKCCMWLASQSKTSDSFKSFYNCETYCHCPNNPKCTT